MKSNHWQGEAKRYIIQNLKESKRNLSKENEEEYFFPLSSSSFFKIAVYLFCFAGVVVALARANRFPKRHVKWVYFFHQ